MHVASTNLHEILIETVEIEEHRRMNKSKMESYHIGAPIILS